MLRSFLLKTTPAKCSNLCYYYTVPPKQFIANICTSRGNGYFLTPKVESNANTLRTKSSVSIDAVVIPSLVDLEGPFAQCEIKTIDVTFSEKAKFQ